MPKSVFADYIDRHPDSGECAEIPQTWLDHDEEYRSFVAVHELTEQVEAAIRKKRFGEATPPHVIKLDFPGGNLKEVWDSLAEIESECKVPNWDGYGAAPLSLNALKEMKVLLGLLPTNLSIPVIVPEPKGSIGLEWRRGKNTILVLSVRGKGVLSYSAVLDAETNRYGVEKFMAAIPQFIQRELFPYFAETP